MDNKKILMQFVEELGDDDKMLLLLEYNIDQPIIVKRGNDSISSVNIGDENIWFFIDTDDGGYEMTYEDVMEQEYSIGEEILIQLVAEFGSHSEVKLMDRQNVITELIDDSIECVFNADSNYDDRTYIDSIFRDGFKGYNNLSDEDLENRYYELLDTGVFIFENIE